MIIANMLPDISNLTRISKALAMLDAILCKDWAMRYYSFNSHWDKDDTTQMMASMRNGSGDHYFIWFSTNGVAIKGFAHQSILAPIANGKRVYAGVLDNVPEEFAEFLSEPAFMMNDTTFCFWRKNNDEVWRSGAIKFPANCGNDPEGAITLLSILNGNPANYVSFAHNYFGKNLNKVDVEHIYQLKPITASLLTNSIAR